jgi:hypothetical protein
LGILHNHSLQILSLINSQFTVIFQFKGNSKKSCISVNCCCLSSFHISSHVSHTDSLYFNLHSFLDRAQQDKGPQWIIPSTPQINLLLINFIKNTVQISYAHSQVLKLSYTLNWLSLSFIQNVHKAST